MTTVAKSPKNAKPQHSHQTNLLLRGFVGLKRPMNGINVELNDKSVLQHENNRLYAILILFYL